MAVVEPKIDGIYSAYFTGMTGSSFGLFAFINGVVAGADAGGAVYDGDYKHASGFIEGEITMRAPAGTMLITGAVSGSTPIEMRIPFKLDVPIEAGKDLRFLTPAGPVNGRLNLVRSLS